MSHVHTYSDAAEGDATDAASHRVVCPYAVNGKVTPPSVTVSESPYIDGWPPPPPSPRGTRTENTNKMVNARSHTHIRDVRVPRTSSDPE